MTVKSIRSIFVLSAIAAVTIAATYEFKTVDTRIQVEAKDISNCLAELESIVCSKLDTDYSLTGDNTCSFADYWSDSTGVRLIKQDGKYWVYAAGLKMPIMLTPTTKAVVDAAVP